MEKALSRPLVGLPRFDPGHVASFFAQVSEFLDFLISIWVVAMGFVVMKHTPKQCYGAEKLCSYGFLRRFSTVFGFLHHFSTFLHRFSTHEAFSTLSPFSTPLGYFPPGLRFFFRFAFFRSTLLLFNQIGATEILIQTKLERPKQTFKALVDEFAPRFRRLLHVVLEVKPKVKWRQLRVLAVHGVSGMLQFAPTKLT